MPKLNYFVGVDVGTGSARAALVTENGKIASVAERKIQTWNPQSDFYEQSSDDIWNSCVYCVKKVVEGIDPNLVKGIGFDATCSLVAVDTQGNPLSVSPTGKLVINNNQLTVLHLGIPSYIPTGNWEQNVILWLDHRAHKQASYINSLNHNILKYVGGKISLEMETPKLLWLKEHLKEQCWDKAGLFLDLPDFLTWKATGCDSRSLCSTVCKWTYEIQENGTQGWNRKYFEEIGLEDLAEDSWKKIGQTVLSPGAQVGSGLSQTVAAELGLVEGTPVGASIIDAHAGGLGLIGCSVDGISDTFHTRLALICGTSTCHMAVSETPIFVPGIWGPYYSAMVPGMWVNEGGQSATGKLIDYIIDSHPVTPSLKNKIGNMHIQQYLSNLLERLAEKRKLSAVAFLTKDLHVYPDFHGNRSPVADPTLKGMVCGLTLSADEENLALLYLAVVQALSYGTRHILEALKNSGYRDIRSILICGGLSKNVLFTQTQADVINLPVVCPEETESVLLGSAVLGASASGYFKDVNAAVKAMGGRGKTVAPNKDVLEYHDKKYKVFLKMLDDQRKYREVMGIVV